MWKGRQVAAFYKRSEIQKLFKIVFISSYFIHQNSIHQFYKYIEMALNQLLISSDIAHISGCWIKLCQGFDLLAKGTVNVVTEYLTIHSAALQNMFKDSLSDEMFTMRSWQEMLREGNKAL